MEEFVVVGAGLAGASTAWHLAMRDQPVTVLERTIPGNDQGSSHGSARIFRYAYPEQLYAELVVRARGGWSELERQSGEQLLTVTGCLDFGGHGEPQELATVLDLAGVTNELLNSEQVEHRWPQLNFGKPAVWQPEAGVLDPQTTIEAMLRLAVETGHARVLTNWEATRLERTANGWRVHCGDGRSVEGSRVIVAAGGWLPELTRDFGIPAEIASNLPSIEVRQEQVYHFPYRDQRAWPTLLDGSDEMLTYSLPGGRDAQFKGQKLARYNGGPVIGSASEQDGVIRDQDRQLMTEYVRRYLPGLEPTPYAEATCLFTNTPTEDFIFELQDGVALVSACSGHGAKFAPLLGELATDLAMGAGPIPGVFRLPHRKIDALR